MKIPREFCRLNYNAADLVVVDWHTSRVDVYRGHLLRVTPLSPLQYAHRD